MEIPKATKRGHIPDLDVCLAYAALMMAREKGFHCEWPYELLATRYDCHQKVAYRACERAHRRGYLDYGVSLRSGWLSEKGKELILTQVPSS
jgi:hypothetical protein